jgi:hypothetical protein
VRAEFQKLFGLEAVALRARDAAAGRPTLVKDAIVALRLADETADKLTARLGVDVHILAATLVAYARFDKLLSLADAPLTPPVAHAAMNAKLVTARFRKTLDGEVRVEVLATGVGQLVKEP